MALAMCTHLECVPSMKVEGVREFRKDVPKLVRDKKLVLVTWHGRPRSVLMPLEDLSKLPRELRMEFLRQSGEEIQDYLRKLGVTEPEVQADFEKWRKAKRAARRRR